jgi:hypothetical protein
MSTASACGTGVVDTEASHTLERISSGGKRTTDGFDENRNRRHPPDCVRDFGQAAFDPDSSGPQSSCRQIG